MAADEIKRALLVIDVQKEYFSGAMPVSYPQGSFDNILSAMDAAGRCGIPVILVRHASAKPDSKVFVKGSEPWQLMPQVAERPHAMIVEKSLPGSFTNTGLQGWLGEKGITTVVIAGYMTQVCCDTTSRQAAHRGFGVEFLSDATGTLDFENPAGKVSAEELHRAILVTQGQGFAEVLSTGEWIKRIEAE